MPHGVINDEESGAFSRRAAFFAFASAVRSFAAHRYPTLDAYRECRPYLLLGNRNQMVRIEPLRPIINQHDKLELVQDVAAAIQPESIDWFGFVFAARTPQDDVICCEIATRDEHSFQYVAVDSEGRLLSRERVDWINVMPASGWFGDAMEALVQEWRRTREIADR